MLCYHLEQPNTIIKVGRVGWGKGGEESYSMSEVNIN